MINLGDTLRLSDNNFDAWLEVRKFRHQEVNTEQIFLNFCGATDLGIFLEFFVIFGIMFLFFILLEKSKNITHNPF